MNVLNTFKPLLKKYAKAYDLVNGVEHGSIRINDYELQEKMFKALGLTPDEIEAKFSFVDAYNMAHLHTVVWLLIGLP